MMKTTKMILCLVSCVLVLFANAQSKKTIYIADRVAVTDSADCLQIKTKTKGEWENIADTIAGLRYEEGFDYKAIVTVTKNQYKLLKLIWRKKTAYNPAVRLQGSKWILRSMFDNNQTLRLPDTTIYMHVDIAKGRVNGKGVCNNFKGIVKAEGGKIIFSEIGFTKMMCVDQGNVLENILTNLLERSINFQIKRGQLTLQSANSNMIFEAH